MYGTWHCRSWLRGDSWTLRTIDETGFSTFVSFPHKTWQNSDSDERIPFSFLFFLLRCHLDEIAPLAERSSASDLPLLTQERYRPLLVWFLDDSISLDIELIYLWYSRAWQCLKPFLACLSFLELEFELKTGIYRGSTNTLKNWLSDK